MKKLFFVFSILSVLLVNSQAFTGKGDQKFQIGANLQDEATGINVTYDYGLGESFSVGLTSSYALSVDDRIDPDFDQRIDLKARFNANLGNVINVDENLDVYPGLNIGLKNFGGHLGARYFFGKGFGVFTEASFPIAKYDEDATEIGNFIHNQFAVNIGAVFQL